MNRGTVITVTLLTALMLVFVFSAMPVYAASAWDVQIIDANAAGYTYSYSPIVFGSDNSRHMLYTGIYIREETYHHYEVPLVMYAIQNGSGWYTQNIVDEDACNLVLDSNNNPHILYGGLGTPLVYASWTGTNWINQTVDETLMHGFGALSLDSSGNPHVAYTNGTAVKYASWTGTNWTIQEVDAYPEIPYQLYLALDSNNTPYIMYDFTISLPSETGAYHTREEVKLATLQNSNWSIQTVADTGDFGNMVLDSKGYPHIIYKKTYPEFTGFDNSSLVYANWNGTAWNTKTVISNVSLAGAGFLAIDSHDYPHISYVTSAETLMYASWTGTTWDIQMVNTTVPAKGPSYLSLDSNDYPYISYLGFSPNGTGGGSGINIVAYMMVATTTQITPIVTPSASPNPSPSIPEFPSWIILPLVTVASLTAAISIRRRKAAP
jgi:hypothetical protein